MTKKTAGFTLLELMIVVAIIGILASIAYPSYTDKVQKSRRADAQGVLMQFAGAMERYFTANNTYSGAAGTTASPADTGAPRIFSIKSPVDGSETYYNLTISAVTAPAASTSTTASVAASFTLSAAPTGKQASDKCGTLTLTNTGVRGSSGAAVADCWK